MRDFEIYLMEEHAEQFIGNKDMMVDDFSDWLDGLSIDDWIAYGDNFGAKRYKDFRGKLLSKLQEVIDWVNCW